MAGSNLKYDKYGMVIKTDANGNPVYADASGHYSNTDKTQQTSGSEYNLGYDKNLFPWLQPGSGAMSYDQPAINSPITAAKNYHDIGVPGMPQDQQAAYKQQLGTASQLYGLLNNSQAISGFSNKDPSTLTSGSYGNLSNDEKAALTQKAQELIKQFGGDANKAAAYAKQQADVANAYGSGTHSDMWDKLGQFAKFIGTAVSMGSLAAYGAAQGAGTATGAGASGSGFSAGVSSAGGAGGEIAGGTGAATALGGESADLLGTTATEAAPTVGGEISGGEGLSVLNNTTPFNLANYLGLDGTYAGSALNYGQQAVGGVQDAFSSPYGKAASTANTVHTALGDLSPNEVAAAKAVGAAAIPLIANAVGGSNQPSSLSQTPGIFNNPNYPKNTAPQYKSIFSGYEANPNPSSSDPYEKFFNTKKKNFADGGEASSAISSTNDVQNSVALKKAVGYKGAPDDASWSAWASDPANSAGYQNWMQSVRYVDPSAADSIKGTPTSTDPYARYGEGPEKLFFTGLDKPIDSTGKIVKSTDTELNQAAKKAAGYTGGFDNPSDFYQWSLSNPDSFVNYLQNINKTNPGFVPGFVSQPTLDWNQNIAGVQTFGPVLNAALGKSIGYTGPVGGGQLGSGLENDYLIAHPEDTSTYQSLRDIVDPTYKWSKKFATGGESEGADGDNYSAGPIRGDGTGKDDQIPAMLSDGEHVITAQEVSALGDGSNDAGQKRLYEFRKRLRAHSTKNGSGHSPKSKDIASYLRGL